MEPPHRHIDEGEAGRNRGQRALRQLGLFAAALLLVVVGGLFAGWLFAKGSPQRAASTLLGDFVVTEPNIGRQPPPEDEPVPTSGEHDGTARCGRVDQPVPVDDQLATLSSGAVVVQYRPQETSEADLALMDELARRDDVLVAPNPRLDDPVVATSWTQRMALPAATRELLVAFVSANQHLGPDAAAPCPRVGGQ